MSTDRSQIHMLSRRYGKDDNQRRSLHDTSDV